MSETGYSLELSFANLYPTMDEEHAFVQGVEFGRILFLMDGGATTEICTNTRMENRTVIARAAAAYGWDASIQPSGTPGWDITLLTKRQAPAISNPRGLRIVR